MHTLFFMKHLGLWLKCVPTKHETQQMNLRATWQPGKGREWNLYEDCVLGYKSQQIILKCYSWERLGGPLGLYLFTLLMDGTAT